MENSVDKQELLDQFEQWRIDDGLPGEYSARPRQADDGQAADGQKGLSQQLFELCEEPETAGGHYVFVVADLRGAKFAYITARALSRKLLSSRTKIVKALMPGPSVAGLSHWGRQTLTRKETLTVHGHVLPYLPGNRKGPSP